MRVLGDTFDAFCAPPVDHPLTLVKKTTKSFRPELQSNMTSAQGRSVKFSRSTSVVRAVFLWTGFFRVGFFRSGCSDTRVFEHGCFRVPVFLSMGVPPSSTHVTRAWSSYVGHDNNSDAS